jgi:alpha,alpha-trehalose phosphorylase
VTGPDEYSAVVDNTAYTNLMARENLEGAVGLVEWLERANPEAHDRLIAATGLAAGEVDDWRAAAERMYVPRDEDLGILMQDERFLDRKPWDFSRSAGDRPLLLDHHPLELYRHQVIKQTDAVLAAYLTGHRLSREEVRRTYDHYEPLTTGDSTLSACIQSVVASAAGHADAALEHFVEACAIDLADSHGNTADGLHIASCGGTWLALVAGFGGLRDFDGCLRLEPQLPARWERLRFRLQAHGQLLEVDLTHAAATYTLLEGTGLVLEHAGEVRRLVPGTPLRIPAPAALPQAA